MADDSKIADAKQILEELGMPLAQQNERSALCLLALLNLTKDKPWKAAENPLVGITPMMEFARDYYGKRYAPNTRETFRRQTIHQFVAVGIALYNPDNPGRPVNSPKAVYQIEPDTLALLRSFATAAWSKNLAAYLENRTTLVAQYAREREMQKLPVKLSTGEEIRLSPGNHSELIKAIIEGFAPRFAPGGVLVYAGDTGDKWGYFDKELLAKLGVVVDGHGKMPDVVLYYPERGWLLLVESVTSHGPVDGKRHAELSGIIRCFDSRPCVRHGVPITVSYDALLVRDRLGNGSLVRGCANAPDPL